MGILYVNKMPSVKTLAFSVNTIKLALLRVRGYNIIFGISFQSLSSLLP